MNPGVHLVTIVKVRKNSGWRRLRPLHVINDNSYCRVLWRIPDDLSNYKMVKSGQFAMNKMKAWQGSYGVSKYTGIVSPAYFVFDFNYDMNPDYFHYAIRSRVYVSFFGQASDGIRVGQWDLSIQRMKEIPFYLPPRSEQDQIVRFLDWKVSNINKLINIKKKEIKDIDALKRSLISHAITHGLSADTPMKYSGVKWLGDIPAHWQIMKLRQILHSISVKNHPELPLLSVVREQGVILRDVEDTESNHNFIPDDLSGYKVVKKGQFAMNKMKAWQGSYGISDYTGIVSPAYFIFDVAFDNLEYFHYAIRTDILPNMVAVFRIILYYKSVTKYRRTRHTFTKSNGLYAMPELGTYGSVGDIPSNRCFYPTS